LALPVASSTFTNFSTGISTASLANPTHLKVGNIDFFSFACDYIFQSEINIIQYILTFSSTTDVEAKPERI
jgi:hypothetical protein